MVGEIDQWIIGKENSEFIVNLTGGTKIMSIAAYEYFKDYGSKMIYIPIPKNEFIVPFPIKSTTPPTQLYLRLKVIEYLTAYGLDITNEHKIDGYKNETIKRKHISKWIVLNYHKIKNLLGWFTKTLRDYRNKKWYVLKKLYNSPTQEDLELLGKLNFSLSNGYVCKKLSKSEIGFLTGGWLEEYCFNEIFKLSGKYIDDVAINISPLNKEGTTNEYDVMFTKDNALYFVECKSLDQSAEKGTSDLYKIGALQKEFGLRIKSFFVSTSRDILKEGQIKKGLKERGEQFNTEIIHPDEIINLSNFFINRLKLSISPHEQNK